MKTHPRRSAFTAMLTVAGLLLTVTAHGASAERKTTRQPGKATQTTTVTNAAGQGGTRTLTASADPATGSISASAAITLTNGETAGRSLNSTRTDTGRTTTAQATGPNGATATKAVVVAKDGDTTTRTATVKTTPPAKP